MKFLLIKLNHLGDTLLLTPTLRMLRQRHPTARIDVMVRSGCEIVLQNNPDLTHLIPIASPEKHRRAWRIALPEFARACRVALGRRYDYAFDLSNSDRAKLWILLSAARHRAINDFYRNLGWKRRFFNRFAYHDWWGDHQVLKDFRTVADVLGIEATPGPLIFIPAMDIGPIKRKIPSFPSNAPYAVIHPTSRWAFKQWLPDSWAALADKLKLDLGLNVIFSSGPAEKELDHIQRILACAKLPHAATQGSLSLAELGLLLKKARLFLGVDTVAMHIAAAVQTPIVALFGPSSEWSWRPWQCPQELVLGDCNCKVTRQFICDKSKPYPCMQSITAGRVLESARRLLLA